MKPKSVGIRVVTAVGTLSGQRQVNLCTSNTVCDGDLGIYLGAGR